MKRRMILYGLIALLVALVIFSGNSGVENFYVEGKDMILKRGRASGGAKEAVAKAATTKAGPRFGGVVAQLAAARRAGIPPRKEVSPRVPSPRVTIP